MNDEKSLVNILLKYLYNNQDDKKTFLDNIKNIIKGEP